MKKTVSLILAVSAAFILASCGNGSKTTKASTGAETVPTTETVSTAETVPTTGTVPTAETTSETANDIPPETFDDLVTGWAVMPDDFSDQSPGTDYFMETTSSWGPPVFGHYVIEDGILTMTSTDGSRIFRFSAEEDGSFIFIQEGSFTPTLIDDRFGVPMTDGSRFVPENPQISTEP